MALFRGKSLVDSVDEIIHLVQTWNVMHCAPPNRTNSKKRAAPSSNMDGDDKFEQFDDRMMTATPAKKNKPNTISSIANLNCLIDLEKEARRKLCKLLVEAIASVHNVCFADADEEQQYLYNAMSRPKHGRGEITLPCFKLCKRLNIKNAQQIAADLCLFISAQIEQNSGVLFLSNPFLKVEAANGRINAYLTGAYIGQIIPLILNQHNSFLSRLPWTASKQRERVMVEYSQPNTHKAFHVGHMRNVALGDCLLRLYEHCGYDTVAVNYYGDEGAHVAKCLWLLQKEMDENKLDLDAIANDDSINKGEWLGNKYAEAVRLLSLSTYTALPFVGVVVAKILSKEKHQHRNDGDAAIANTWHVVTVQYAANPCKIATVVCGGTHYDIGNLIAYKMAEKKDLKGVMSEGVILSALELGVKLKNNNQRNKNCKNKKKKKRAKDQRIYLVDAFYANAEIGDKLSQLAKYKCDEFKSECAGTDVCELWSERVSQQENVLKLLESGDAKYVSLWRQTRRWSLDEFGAIYKWLGARFDDDFFESECSEESRKLVDEYYNRGIFVKSEGAIGCNLSEDLGFCLLLKSSGCGLYATKDLALALRKFSQFKIDRSIYVVDSSQERHFKQVFATLRCMGYQRESEKCEHLSYAFVRLPSGKMSTRTGNVILFSELVKLLAAQIQKSFLADKQDSDWDAAELLAAERAISVGTIRYGMLNHDNNKEIVFDLAKWSLSSGNTGPYLMYQYARIASISRKVEFPQGLDGDINDLDYSALSNESEIAKTILFELSHFQSKITEITMNKSPSQLCDYLYSICKLFSQWYCIKDNSIMHCEDTHLKAVRLQFCDAVAKTIKVGIQLLGITPLERM